MLKFCHAWVLASSCWRFSSPTLIELSNIHLVVSLRLGTGLGATAACTFSIKIVNAYLQDKKVKTKNKMEGELVRRGGAQAAPRWGRQRQRGGRDKLAVHERAIALGHALDKSTTYSSALNSYLTFCKIHSFPVDPTPDTLSFFVTFMCRQTDGCTRTALFPSARGS
ncbi:hypothetical protein VTO73DRAFT_6577 [Trametes versicolor]